MLHKLPHEIPPAPDETELVQRAACGEAAAVRAIIGTYNQRLYRLVRAVMRNDQDAEDVLQETYLQAFRHLDGFKGDASLSTWLSRIALNTAFQRLRSDGRMKRKAPEADRTQGQVIPFPLAATFDNPERLMAQRQLLQLVEEATDALPAPFRLVFVARVIEGLSVEETAQLLSLPAATVKTRLHRARKLVKEQMEAKIGPIFLEAFPFAGRRCQRLTDEVLARLGLKD